jgi:hypothetical protein
MTANDKEALPDLLATQQKSEEDLAALIEHFEAAKRTSSTVGPIGSR